MNRNHMAYSYPDRTGVVEPAAMEDGALFSLIYDRFPLGVAQCSLTTGRILKNNHRWGEILGYSQAELSQLTIMELIHPDHRQDYWEAERWLFLGEARSFTLESRLYRENVADLWVNLSLWALDESSAPPSSIVVAFVDIAAQKRAQAECGALEQGLGKAQRLEALGTMAGGVMHDFNNILTSIIGYAELAAESLPPDAAGHEDLEVIRSSAWRGSNLVRSLLAFSRNSSEELIPIPMAAAVAEIGKIIRATTPALIEIGMELEEVGTVMAGAVHVQQIVMNLCTNASQAMGGQGQGRLAVGLIPVLLPEDAPGVDLEPGPYARLTVRDTGVGIDSLTKGRIFEPFFTTKEVGEGTGLGLSVVLGLVRRLEGGIEVESEPGQGACFTVYLPVNYSPPQQDDEPGPGTIPSGGGGRILIVDDEVMIANLVQQILSKLGYEAVAVNCSRQALLLLGQEHFDLLLADLTMPGLSGIELIRQVSASSRIKSILTTGYSETVDEAAALAAGASAFLLKPFVKADLARTIRAVLDGNCLGITEKLS